MYDRKINNMKEVQEKKLVFNFFKLFTDKKFLLITLALIVLPLLVYVQVYNFKFLWDDGNSAIGHLNNLYVQVPSIKHVVHVFTNPFFGMYVPIYYLSWGSIKWLAIPLELSVSGVLHISNVVMHIINGLLVFVLIRQFTTSRYATLVGALFFLLHPIQVESVAWSSEFRGLLASFFSLLVIYFYMKNKTLYFALLLLVLALLSKPSAAAAPLFIFAINHFYYKFSFKANIIKVLPFIVIVVIIAAVTYIIQTTTGVDDLSQHVIPYWQRPLVWLDSIIFYLYKIIIPYSLGASYALSPQFIVSQWWFYPLSIPALMLFVLSYLLRDKYPLLVLAFVLFIVGFLATSGLISFAFQKYSIVADRYMYFSFIGISLAISLALEMAGKKYLFIIFIVILLVFASLSAFRQIPIWKDTFSLWQHSRSLEAVPSYAKVNLSAALYNNRHEFEHIENKGLELAEKGEIDNAIDIFDYLLEHYLDNGRYNFEYSNLFYNRGVLNVKRKQFKQALPDFIKAIQINPKNIQAMNAKLFAYINLEQYKKAWLEVANILAIKEKVAPSLLIDLQKICPYKDC